MIIADWQRVLLNKVAEARAEEKAWLADFEERKKREKETGRAQFRARMLNDMAAALAAGVPKAQVSRAYGTATFANVPMGREAVELAQQLTFQPASNVSSEPKPEVKAAPPSKEAPAEGFIPENVVFTTYLGTRDDENDFGAPIWVEDWEVVDPSGSVQTATVYGAQEGTEDQSPAWGVNFDLAAGVDTDTEMDVLSAVTMYEDVFHSAWRTAKGGTA